MNICLHQQSFYFTKDAILHTSIVPTDKDKTFQQTVLKCQPEYKADTQKSKKLTGSNGRKYFSNLTEK